MNASKASNEAVISTNEILAGRKRCPPAAGVRVLVKELKRLFEFALARRLIDFALTPGRGEAPLSAIQDENTVKLHQEAALCTYKDENRSPARRFAEALSLLEKVGLRAPYAEGIPRQTVPETLALGGAVYKRIFEHGGRLEDLYESLAFYEAAWEFDHVIDKGYGGVNAAYIMDQLANRLRAASVRSRPVPDNSAPQPVGAPPSRAIDQLMNEANRLTSRATILRDEIIKEIEGKAGIEKDYWYDVTLAEVYLGLTEPNRVEDTKGYFKKICTYLTSARDKLTVQKDGEWTRQTTFKQLVSLALLRGCRPPPEPKIKSDESTEIKGWPPVWQALACLFDRGAWQAFSCWREKVGLALSGGGFRASFFHLGVLARMAEMDALRGVDVISTVSGGSVVGAQYYLEVRRLLMTKPDADITKDDYLDIVEKLQKDFFNGVKKNLRTRVLTNLWCNIRMIFSEWGFPAYTRSHRIGELYESWLFSAVDDRLGNAPRKMRDLLITPKDRQATPGGGGPGAPARNPDDTDTFKPKFSNWRRYAKVPVLLINATSLNSGHNWHFTATSMGEPAGLLGQEVDANTHYLPIDYDDAPPALKDYRLGYAVAASSGVPVLFDPLAIEGLYDGHTVRLVDGGVHDNQGVAGLLDESCKYVLCSDACGQMTDIKSPGDDVLSVAMRCSSIEMDRVREAQYQDLAARVQNGALRGLFFVHLKEDLQPAPLNPVNSPDPVLPPPVTSNRTGYQVDRGLQEKLAAIRTDLDSFTGVEADSLMLSGYLMTKWKFEKLDVEHQKLHPLTHWGGFDIPAPQARNWPFLDSKLVALIGMAPDSGDPRRDDLGLQLGIGSSPAFRIWRLNPVLHCLAVVALVLLVVIVLWLIYAYWGYPICFGTVKKLFIGLVLFGVAFFFPLARWLNLQKQLRNELVKLGLATLGFVIANIHILIFNRLSLCRGRLARLLGS